MGGVRVARPQGDSCSGTHPPLLLSSPREGTNAVCSVRLRHLFKDGDTHSTFS